MQTISTKELRLKLPFVRSELAKGTEFLLIHQSKPIATLTPFNKEKGIPWHKTEEGQMWMRAQDEDIVKHTDPDDYLTEEEVKYYLKRIKEYETR